MNVEILLAMLVNIFVRKKKRLLHLTECSTKRVATTVKLVQTISNIRIEVNTGNKAKVLTLGKNSVSKFYC